MTEKSALSRAKELQEKSEQSPELVSQDAMKEL
jgi:hypothetical protein